MSEAVLRLGTDPSGMVRGYEEGGRAADRFRGRVRQSSDAVDRKESALQSLGRQARSTGMSLQRTGRGMSVWLTTPLVGAAAASLKLASDAEEVASKFDVVFGPAADRARQRLEDLQATVPATTRQLEQMASGLQDLLVPMGVARESATDMSLDMVELASDIASFNNVAAPEVIAAFSSALAGASQPMRRYGVDTRATRLEQLALEEGLIRAGQEMSETTRAQAVLIAIQRDSTDAMGDAARTTESFANQARFLKREVTEAGEQIGAVLIPAVIPLLSYATDLVGVIARLDEGTIMLVVGFGAVAAAAGPVIVVMGTLLKSFGAMAVLFNPAGALLVGVGALAALFAGAYVRSMIEAERQSRAFEQATRDLRRELRELGDEAQRVTLEQFQRQVLQTQAELAELEAQRAAADAEMAEARPASGRLGLGLETAAVQTTIPHDLSRQIDEANARLEEQQALLEAARDVFFEVADAASETNGNVENTTDAASELFEAMAALASVYADALDLEIERADLLVDSLRVATELRQVAEDQNRTLEDRIRAQRELNSLTDAVSGSLDRQIQSGLRNLEVTGQWHSGLMQLPDTIYEVDLAFVNLGRSGSESARTFEQEWIAAINVVAANLGGLTSQVANVASAFALGGPAAGVAAFAGAAFSIVRDDSRQQERFREAAREWESALDDFVSMFEDQSRWDRMRAQVEQGAAEMLSQAFLAAASNMGGMDQMRASAAGQFVGQIFERDGIEAAIEAARSFAGALGMTGEAIEQVVDAMREHQRAIEEQIAREKEAAEERRVQDVGTMRERFEVRELAAGGQTLLAEQRREEIQRAQELAEAIALGDDALVDYIRSVYAAEDAFHEAARMRAQREVELSLAEREARLAGDDRGALEASLQREAEAEMARAQAMVDAGRMTEEQFRRTVDVITGETNQALRDFDQAMRDAARAAWEAAEAARFAEEQDLRRLQAQLLRERGDDAGAMQLTHMVEMEAALRDGRSGTYIETLRLLQAERERNRLQRSSVEGVNRLNEAMNTTSRVLNAPQGLPVALLRNLATRQAFGTAPTAGARTVSSGGSRIDVGGVEINVVQREGESGEELANRIGRVIQKILQDGGTSPFAEGF